MDDLGRNKIHIYPTNDRAGWRPNFYAPGQRHCIDDTGMCGCKPEQKQPCPDSSNITGECLKDCWRCGGTGLLDVSPDSLYHILIIHKEHGQLVYPEYPDKKLKAK